MLEVARPDSVHICTPLDSHGPLATEAIRHGIHALIEKPFARSLEETHAIIDAATTAGIIVCPVHQFVFQDGVHRMQSCLPALGEVSQIRCTIASVGGMGMSNASQEALIADILPHPLSLLCMLWPERPLSVLDWHLIRPRHGELMIAADLCGAILNLSISLSARPTRCEFDVVARQGSVHVDLFHGYAVVESGEVTRRRKIARPFVVAGKTLTAAGRNLVHRTVYGEPAYPGLRNLVLKFYAAVQNNGEIPLGTQHILDVAAAREQLLKAVTANLPYLPSESCD